MSDEQMDARLRSAGDAWRAANEPTTDIEAAEPHSLTTPAAPPERRSRTGLFASAAIVAAALVAGASVLVANITGDSGPRATDTEVGTTLDGTVWRFLGYDDHLLPNSLATLYLGKDGTFIADDTCGLIGARADTGGGRLALSELDVRYYNCTDSVGEVVFDPDLLSADPSYSLDRDGLTISGNGKTMHLVAAPQLPAPTLDRPTFTGATWWLVRATDADGRALPAAQRQNSFRVVDGRFETKVSCNTVSGDITDNGLQADLTAVKSTTLPCPAPQPVDDVLGAVFQPGRIETQVLGAQLTISRDGAGSLTYDWVPADTQATDTATLVDRLWQLTSVAGNPVGDRVVLNVHSDGTVTGYDGCRELGSAQGYVGAGTLTVTGIPPADFQSANCNSDLATTVDSLLTQRPALWHIAEDGALVINGPGAQAFALVFQLPDPSPTTDPNQPPALTGTPWNLVAIKDADGTDLPVAGNGSFQIDADGHVTGNDGCNSMSGDARIVDGTIEFPNGLAVTEMACLDDNVMATAQRVDTILGGTVDWSIDGNRLTLFRDGDGTLIYQAGKPPTASTDPADLIGTDWTLTTIEDGTGPDGVASSTAPLQMRIADAPAGLLFLPELCLRASVVVGKGTLDIATFTATSVDCHRAQPDADKVEQVFAGHVTWEITDGQLTITKQDVGALVYTRQANQLPLVGTPWTLRGMQNGSDASASGTGGFGVVLHIYANGSYVVSTNCVPYEGAVDIIGQSITFSNQHDSPGTHDQCLNVEAEQLKSVLDGTVSWSVDAGELTLTKGDATATFTG